MDTWNARNIGACLFLHVWLKRSIGNKKDNNVQFIEYVD